MDQGRPDGAGQVTPMSSSTPTGEEPRAAPSPLVPSPSTSPLEHSANGDTIVDAWPALPPLPLQAGAGCAEPAPPSDRTSPPSVISPAPGGQVTAQPWLANVASLEAPSPLSSGHSWIYEGAPPLARPPPREPAAVIVTRSPDPRAPGDERPGAPRSDPQPPALAPRPRAPAPLPTRPASVRAGASDRERERADTLLKVGLVVLVVLIALSSIVLIGAIALQLGGDDEPSETAE